METECNLIPFLVYVIISAVIGVKIFTKANDHMSIGDFLFLSFLAWAFLPFYFVFLVVDKVLQLLGTTIWKKKEEDKPW